MSSPERSPEPQVATRRVLPARRVAARRMQSPTRRRRSLSPIDRDVGHEVLESSSETSPQDRPNAEQTDTAVKIPITTVAEGTVVDLPGRDPRLPTIWIVDSHPLVPDSRCPRSIYVTLQDTTAEAMEEYYKFLEEATFPEGTEDGVVAAGFLRLYPGDYILVRDIHGDGNPEHDSMQTWVMADSLISEEDRKAITTARDEALGPREERTPDKPTLVDGVYSGGTLWERHRRAVPVGTSERCFTLVQSHQAPRNLVGPSAGVKMAAHEDPDPHVQMREKVVKAAAPLAVAALKAGPDTLYETLDIQADVTNMPRIGIQENCAFPTKQLNLSSTKHASACALPELKADLGGFAGKHIDTHDSSGGITSMISHSDIAEDENPGYFMVGDFGVAIELRGLIVTCFCGLRFHGGFPPTAPAGQSPEPWSYRFVVVCYPPSAQMDGTALTTLAPLPGGRCLYMPPEFIDPHLDNAEIKSNIASWITSGWYLTSPEAFLDYYYRSMCQLSWHLTRQVPAEAHMQVDFKKLAECFSLKNKAGDVIYPKFWELHPGSELKSSTHGCTRQEATARWDSHKEQQGRYIPHYVHVQRQKKANEQAQKRKQPGDGEDGDAPLKKKKKSGKKGKNGAEVGSEALDGETADANHEAVDPSMSEVEVEDTENPVADVLFDPTEILQSCRPEESADIMDVVMHEHLPKSVASDDPPHAAEQEEVSETVGQVIPNQPRHEPVLRLFRQENLSRALDVYETLAQTVASEDLGLDASCKDMRDFMAAFGSDGGGATLLGAFSRMWTSHGALSVTSDLFGLRLAFHRRQLMLCSAAGWYWLHHCTQRCRTFLEELPMKPDHPPSSDWLLRLCHDIYTHVKDRTVADLDAGDYMAHLKDKQVRGHIERPRILEDDITSRVCEQVVSLLREWLGFPNNTEQLRGYFVMYLVGSFQNSDVLLLDGVWQAYREVKAAVLGVKMKPQHLRVSMMEPFALAVRSEPLADANSSERDLMGRISAAIERCAPGVRRWTDSIIHSLLSGAKPPSVPASRLRVVPLPVAGPSTTAMRATQPAASVVPGSIPGPSSASLVTSTTADGSDRGMAEILQFALELLPVARGETIPSPTKLQLAAMQNSDHFTPWRNLGASRLRVTSPGGPFHADTIDKPGAWPSCIITRALLFDTHVQHFETLGYFEDKAAWEAFVAAHYNPSDKESRRRFFNDKCYGTLQAQRTKYGLTYVAEYFDGEPRYKKLLAAHGERPVPFEEFFLWTQGKVYSPSLNGKHRYKHIDKPGTMVGGLTGYLLTADLVYAGKVARPSVEEVGRIIKSNDMGSCEALVIAGLLESTKAPENEVVAAFARVHALLEQNISAEDQKLVGFDPIVVEHLLCKFKRTRELQGKPRPQKKVGKGKGKDKGRN